MAGAGAEDRPEAGAASEDLRGASRYATVYYSKDFDGLAGTDLEGVRIAEQMIRVARDGKETRLHLYGYGLASLPDMIETISEFKKIVCDWNRLTTLPDSLGKCVALTHFNCAGNKLTTLPAALGNCTSLKVIQCCSNQLTSLPDSLGNCTALETLWCRKNRLTTLPDSLGNCTVLKELWCSRNPWDEAWLRAQELKPGENPTIDSLRKLSTGRRVKAARLTSHACEVK